MIDFSTFTKFIDLWKVPKDALSNEKTPDNMKSRRSFNKDKKRVK